jgi:hypothetical protein
LLAAHDARFADELKDEGHVLLTTMLIVLGLCIKGRTAEHGDERGFSEKDRLAVSDEQFNT